MRERKRCMRDQRQRRPGGVCMHGERRMNIAAVTSSRLCSRVRKARRKKGWHGWLLSRRILVVTRPRGNQQSLVGRSVGRSVGAGCLPHPLPLLAADIYHFSERRAAILVGIERSGRAELQKRIVQVSHRRRCGSRSASSQRAISLSLSLIIIVIIDALLCQLRPPQTQEHRAEETKIERRRRRRRRGGRRGCRGDGRHRAGAPQEWPDGFIGAFLLLLLLFFSGV